MREPLVLGMAEADAIMFRERQFVKELDPFLALYGLEPGGYNRTWLVLFFREFYTYYYIYSCQY